MDMTHMDMKSSLSLHPHVSHISLHTVDWFTVKNAEPFQYLNWPGTD